MSATQIDFLLAGVTDSSGNALSGGKVYSYIAGTSTPATLYQDSGQATPHTNPVMLDGKGTKLCFGDGNFKLVIKDSDDNTIDTFDNLKFGTEDQDTIFAGTSTGSSNAYVLAPSPAVESYYTGLTLRFIANFANTGATTVNVSGLGVKDIKQGDGDATSTGDMLQNAFITISYNGTNFRLLSSDAANANAIAQLQVDVDALEAGSATKVAVQDGSYISGTTGGAANVQTLTLSPAISAYATNQKFHFIAGFTNTSTCTLNVNAVGAKNIFNNKTGAALAGNEIIAGRAYEVIYDGTQFLLLNPSEEWQTWSTPALAVNSGSASFESTSASYKRVGNQIFINLATVYTYTSGTPTEISFNLPVTASNASSYTLYGHVPISGNANIWGITNVSTTSAKFVTTGSFGATSNGGVFKISGFYIV